MFEKDPMSDNCTETIKEEEGPTKPKLITRQKTTRKKPEANAWSSQKKALIKDEKRAVAKLYEQGGNSIGTQFWPNFKDYSD